MKNLFLLLFICIVFNSCGDDDNYYHLEKDILGVWYSVEDINTYNVSYMSFSINVLNKDLVDIVHAEEYPINPEYNKTFSLKREGKWFYYLTSDGRKTNSRLSFFMPDENTLIVEGYTLAIKEGKEMWLYDVGLPNEKYKRIE